MGKNIDRNLIAVDMSNGMTYIGMSRGQNNPLVLTEAITISTNLLSHIEMGYSNIALAYYYGGDGRIKRVEQFKPIPREKEIRIEEYPRVIHYIGQHLEDECLKEINSPRNKKNVFF